MVTLFAAWLACTGDSPVEHDVVSVVPPWPWELSGCWTMDTGPRCVVGIDRPLTLWVGAEVAPELEPPELLASPWEVHAGGFLATLATSGDATVEVTSGRTRLVLHVEARDQPPVLVEARALASRGDVAAVLDTLEPALASEDVDLQIAAGFRLATLGERPMADVEERARAAGRWWWAAAAAMTSARDHLTDRRDGLRALGDLDRARNLARGPGRRLGFVLEHSLDYYEGRAYLALGNHRAAMAAFHRVEERADRVGHTIYASRARRDIAESLVRFGSVEEALGILRDEIEALAPVDDACERAMALNGYGWALVQARDAGWSNLEDSAADVLDDGLELLDGACSHEHRAADHRSQLHLNRALAALQDHDVDVAAYHLDRHRDSGASDPWALVAEGRLHLARGEPRRALRAFEALERRAGDQLELQWFAHRGQGLAHASLDQRPAAIRELQRAQSLLFRQALLVPVYFGPTAYLRQRRDAAARLAQLLRESGHLEAAFDAHRRSRASFVGALHHFTRLQSGDATMSRAFQESTRAIAEAEAAMRSRREVWEIPLDELEEELQKRTELERRIARARDRGFAALGVPVDPERRRPRQGELLLGWFAEPDGWVGYAEDERGVAVSRRADPPSPDELFAPFGDAIRRADVITLLLPDELASVDVHRAGFEGRPLIASVPVRYGIDLAGPGRSAGTGAPQRRALVVGDPQLNLVLAREQVVDVADTLGVRGFQVEELLGPRATRRAVLERFDTDWLHFSGHGKAGPAWQSGLVMSDGAITVSDVLAAARAPRIAVLNACVTAREPGGGLAVAAALVIAGTEEAVAPGAEVSDRIARLFSRRLYAELAAGSSLPRAYTSSLLDLASAEPAVWTYRVVHP